MFKYDRAFKAGSSKDKWEYKHLKTLGRLDVGCNTLVFWVLILINIFVF